MVAVSDLLAKRFANLSAGLLEESSILEKIVTGD